MEALPFSLGNILPPDRYQVTVIQGRQGNTVLTDLNCDCLVIFDNLILDKETFLPTVKIVDKAAPPHDIANHIVILDAACLADLPTAIDQAITKFLAAPPLVSHPLALQEHTRLSEKLKERLGYLGVYYKRNSAFFLRAMSEGERHNYLAKLKRTYHSIVLEYFKDTPDRLNQKIDEFANMAFLADVSVAQVLEIHMDLMDKLGKQLRLEGHKDQILLDYRITLIDVIAHLCEMYRRSIPREASTV